MCSRKVGAGLAPPWGRTGDKKGSLRSRRRVDCSETHVAAGAPNSLPTPRPFPLRCPACEVTFGLRPGVFQALNSYTERLEVDPGEQSLAEKGYIEQWKKAGARVKDIDPEDRSRDSTFDLCLFPPSQEVVCLALNVLRFATRQSRWAIC